MSIASLRFTPTAKQLQAQRHASHYGNSMTLGIPWYRQFTGTNLRASRGWSAAALGVYHALRDAQWDRGYLPPDPEEIRHLTGFHPREWQAAWPLVREHFPIAEDGSRRNREMAEERYESIGLRWQQIDASRSRFAGWYRGKSADNYLVEHCLRHPSDDASGDLSGDTSLHHHHHPNIAYQGAKPLREDSE